MSDRLKRSLHAFLTRTDGVASATSVYILLGMLMVGGLAVDASNAIRSQARLQAMADAAAMSAAMHLPDAAMARAVALDVAERNSAAGQSGRVEITADDIVIGTWVAATGTVQPGAFRPDAIAVTARNDTRNGNPVQTLLLRLVGIDRMDVAAAAIGYKPVMPPCSGGGYFSRERTVVVNANHFREGFCVHGDQGVTLNNTNTFDPGTEISMNDLADFVATRNNYGVDEALRRGSHTFARLDALPDMMAAMRGGDLLSANLPDHIISGPVTLGSINSNTVLTPGTLYVVNGNVNFGSNNQIRDVAIVAGGTIRANSNTTFENVVLASDRTITFNSNNYVGESAHHFCTNGSYSTYLLTKENIVFNSNNAFRGVMMLANGTIDTGNNNDAADGIYAEAGGRISLGNANSNAGCPEGLEREVGPDDLREVFATMVY